MKSLSHVRLLMTPWTAAHQAPPSMGFSRQEYWSGVPLPFPGEGMTSVFSAPFSQQSRVGWGIRDLKARRISGCWPESIRKGPGSILPRKRQCQEGQSMPSLGRGGSNSCQFEQGGGPGSWSRVGARGIRASSRNLDIPRACQLVS